MNFEQCSMSKEGLLLNLEKGLDIEERARDLCAELLEVLDDEQDLNIVKKILADEIEHVRIMKELIVMTKAFYTNK